MDCVNSGERCFICGKDVPVLIAVGEKGKQKLKLTSIERNDGNITFLNKSSSACSCRKSGLYCTEVCTGCHGASCLNVTSRIEDVETLMQEVNSQKAEDHIEHESL